MSIKPTKSFMKVAALLALLSLGPATIYVLYTRTGGPESQKERTFQINLRYALMAGTDTVDFAPLTAWDYDTVCAIDSAVTLDQLTQVIGFEYKDYGELHWLRRADMWTLLFIDVERDTNWGKHRPVTPIRIPRAGLTDVALPEGTKGVCVPRAKLTVSVSRRAAPVGSSPAVLELKQDQAG
ncbi:MAG: hypothetical protein FJX59_12415 [Alphaproteobacteria bacterium]|nr:hypothetical protein [Alphaproteobacteria bacterium]